LIARFAILLLFTLCSTASAQRKIELAPAAGEGGVLLTMQSARPTNVFNPKWKTVRVSNEIGRSYELNDLSEPQSASSLFYERLPAGVYQITEVQTVGYGPGLLLALIAGDFQDLRLRELRFEVRDGALANLGTAVDSPPVDKDPKSRRVVLLRGAFGRAAALESLESRAGQAVSLRSEGGWSGEETAQEAERALARARALMSVISPGDDMLDSVVFGGTALGQILWREAGGEWRSEPLDTLAAVTYARRLADGTLLAGTDHGRLYERRPGGPWRRLQLKDTGAVVRHIEPLAEDAWLVTAQKLKDVSVYRIDAAGAVTGPIASVETFGEPYVGALANADALMLTRTVSSISRESQLTILDKRSLRAEVRAEIDKYLVIGYQRLRSGEIAMDRYVGLSHYVSFSGDGGRSWRHAQAEAPLWPLFADAQRGYGLALNRGLFSVDSVLMKTVDGGNSWTQTGEAVTVETAGRVIGIAPDGTIIASLGWEVRSSRDEGKTWQRELPRFLD
jgi:photosystem II stability/assembly factor-like uncharacterized protein